MGSSNLGGGELCHDRSAKLRPLSPIGEVVRLLQTGRMIEGFPMAASGGLQESPRQRPELTPKATLCAADASHKSMMMSPVG